MTTKITSDNEAAALFDAAFSCEESGELDKALEIRLRLIEYDTTKEKFILAVARSFQLLRNNDNAEKYYRKSIFMYPFSELSSLQLFHFLIGVGKTDEAFEEVKRFESISHSEDYSEIIKTINESDKY